MTEGRFPPEPVRTRPEGLIERLELAKLELGRLVEDLGTAKKIAQEHSHAAQTQIGGARAQIRYAQDAIDEAKRSLERDTVAIAAGLKKSTRQPI